MQRIYNEISDVLSGIGCFEGTFRLQVEEVVKYTKHLKEGSICNPETTWGGAGLTTKATRYSTLDVDEMSEWCNTFVPVLKAIGKVQMCLDPTRPHKALMRLTHRGPTLNDILPRLTTGKYLTLIDVSQGLSQGYHNLK